MSEPATGPAEQDVETLLAAFPSSDDVRHLQDFALGGSRAALRSLVRVARMGGERGRRAHVALAVLAQEGVLP